MKIKSNPPFRAPTFDETAALAKQLWETNGKPDGRDDEFWFQAERQLATSAASATPSKPRTGKSSPGLKPSKDDGLRKKTQELLDDTGEGTNRSPTALNLDRS